VTNPFFIAASADKYSIARLADIYNESRVDYIVPMPMNTKRLHDYVAQYDVDLSASVVAVNQDQQVAGIGMLGVRGTRAWITRLGVIPTRRGRGVGQFIMDSLLTNAVSRGCQSVLLEVIEGNEPAYGLFSKLSFETIRRLLVIRRAPNPLPAETLRVEPLNIDQITLFLSRRPPVASWLNETPSILAGGSTVEGLCVSLDSGEMGWIVYRSTPFQLSHFILGSVTDDLSDECARALLRVVHTRHPRRDTKVENLPADSPLWAAYQALGYGIEFTRIEMIKPL